MLRRFNATGRKKIVGQHALVRILPANDGDKRRFEIELDLTSYQFPSDARVRVEAQRSNVAEHWDFGAAGQLAPDTYSKIISQAPITSQFKVIVVAGDGSGKLLGASASITPKQPTESLIPLTPTDLGHEVWRVSFGDDDELPVLEVNSSIEAISEIVRSDTAFRSLVMPQVLRTVLTQIIFVLGGDTNDDEESWHLGWFRLAQSFVPGKPPKLSDDPDPSEKTEASEWIERVVEAFAARKVQAAERYRDAQQAAS